MRAIWSGSLSFGLVNIPVKMFTAVQESSLNLDMLDSSNYSNIKFKRVNADTGKEVPNDKIVKGYLYEGEYVILEDNDFKQADAKKSKVIEVDHFVKETEVESIYYEQPYYLQPTEEGKKAYGILRDALAKAGMIGVATFVLRNKETLALVKPYGKAILLNRIRFEEEIRSMDELDLPEIGKAGTKEQEMAIQLVKQLSQKFDISKYKDTYTDKLLEIIEAKSKGKTIKPVSLKVVHTKSDDLMAMLKASLEKKGKGKNDDEEEKPARKKAAKKTSKSKKTVRKTVHRKAS